MERLNGNQVFWLALVCIIGLIICIATGHNGPLITAFISINGAVFTGTGIAKIKEVISRGSENKKEE